MPWRRGNRLHLVGESQASSRVAEIFDELKSALGTSYVPLPFQAFAGYPGFLTLQWRVMKPVFAAHEFFDLAARVQAEAFTYVHNYFKIPAIGEGLVLAQAAPVVDTFCYVEPVLLLMLSVHLQAFEGSIGKAAVAHPSQLQKCAGVPEFVDPENATPAMRRVFEDIRHVMDLPYCGDEQRALAQWPELFFSFWHAIKPAMQSVFYEQAIYRMRESAWNCAQEIPVQIDMEFSRLQEAGVDADDIATITRLTELLLRGSAGSVLNATFARIGLEGGNGVADEQPRPGEHAERVA